MTERMKKADAFQKMNFNCAQSVLAAFGDLTGLDDETAKKVAGGLGGGIGGCRNEVCGALSGAKACRRSLSSQTLSYRWR